MYGFSYRYQFCIIQNGIRTTAYINGNNQMSAFAKAKRMFPMAEKIRIVRIQKLY